MQDDNAANMMSFIQNVAAEFMKANSRREVVFEAENAGRSFDYDLVRVKFGKVKRSLILEANADADPPKDIAASDVAEEIAKRVTMPDTIEVGARIRRITDPPVSLESILSAIRSIREQG